MGSDFDLYQRRILDCLVDGDQGTTSLSLDVGAFGMDDVFVEALDTLEQQGRVQWYPLSDESWYRRGVKKGKFPVKEYDSFDVPREDRVYCASRFHLPFSARSRFLRRIKRSEKVVV